MRKILYVMIFTVLAYVNVSAQQEYQVSQNMFNHMGINPAYAGFNEKICGSLIYRNQWMGFDGAPKTGIFSFDAPFRIGSLKSGAGLTVLNDQLGFEKNLGVRLSYAARFSLGSGNLGLGIMAGFFNKSMDFKPISESITKQYVQAGDPLLVSNALETDMLFDMGFGAFYQIPNKLYVGLSTSQMLETEGAGYGSSPAKALLKRHYYLTSGYEHELNPDIKLKPSVFVKFDGSSFQLDINTLAEYKEFLWGGLSYRPQDAVVAMVGMYPFKMGGDPKLSPLRFGLAYDITTSSMSKGGSIGSMELMVSYCFKIEREKIPSSYRNIRYL